MKLGGVLVDGVRRGDSAPAHILGVGLNVNQQEDELPTGTPFAASSLQLVRGRPVDRTALLRTLLDELDTWYRRLAMGRPEEVLSRWRSLSCLLGHEVKARVGEGVLSGTVAGISATGELILRDAAGRRHLLSDDRTRLLL
jgi:BirA family biotin operon repressor/biotin-[acetyl-CoA-carboxylase] ligase